MLILKTQLSVKELKRQIHTLAFERLGLSEDNKYGLEQLQNKITPVENKDLI